MPYVRPYGSAAPWNRPVAGLPVHTQSTFYRDKLWDIGSNVAGNFNLRYNDFTFPVYETTGAPGTRTVTVSSDGNWNGQTVPFDPAWVAAPGTDAQMIILNPSTGEEWNFFGVTSITATHINCVRCNRITVNENNSGGAASYFTKANGFQPSRGIGIQYYAMLVRPEEISEVGEIRHALSMPVKSTHCTVSVPPATKVEGSAACVADGIPEGLRFALNITETDITNWLNALPADVPTAMKDSLRIIARALRDYGWFITDTSGTAGLQLEARVSAASKWDAIGMGPEFESQVNFKIYPQDALDGLMTQARIYALAPSNEYPPENPPMTTYFVKNGGSDAASGLDDANAWATISKVNTFALQTGDIVQFKNGSTWAETLLVKSNVTYQNYSTGNFPRITGSAAVGASVGIISRSNVTLKNIDIINGQREGIWASDSNFITLENVKLDNNAQTTSQILANLYAQFSNDWTVKSCTISNNNGSDNVYLRTCHRWLFDLCTITDPGPHSGDNIQFTSCVDPTVQNSTLGGVIDSGKGNIIFLHYPDGGTGGLVFNNEIANGNYGVSIAQPNVKIQQNSFENIGGASGWGSAFYSNKEAINPANLTGVVITNNLVLNANRCITIEGEVPGTWGYTVTFNTFVGTPGTSPWIEFSSGTITGEFRRNIVKNITTARLLTGANIAGFSMRENFYENVTNAPFNESGSLTGNAQLDVNFIPQVGSPAVGYGYTGAASTNNPPPSPPPPPPPPGSPPPPPPPVVGTTPPISYFQIMNSVRDSNFLKRIEFATVRVAREVLEESTGTSNHTARLAMAKRVLSKSFPYDLMGTFVVADPTFFTNFTIQSTGATAGTDQQMETIIRSLWTTISLGIISGA